MVGLTKGRSSPALRSMVGLTDWEENTHNIFLLVSSAAEDTKSLTTQHADEKIVKQDRKKKSQDIKWEEMWIDDWRVEWRSS